MKVVLLMPILMVENTRKVNNKALDYALKHYDIDLLVINDIEYMPEDYREDSRIQYLNKRYVRRTNSVDIKNSLLKWFYKSNYDWAVWFDADSNITSTTINDFRTILNVIEQDRMEVDVILSTLGLYMSESRIAAKMLSDHLENVWLTSVSKSESAWMYGMFFRNFKKAYDMEVYISEECDSQKGLNDDVYFVQLLKRLFEVRQCPTIVVTKPFNEFEVQVDEGNRYKYIPIAWDMISNMVRRSELQPAPLKSLPNAFVYKRVDYMLDKVTSYKPRKKKKGRGKLL